MTFLLVLAGAVAFAVAFKGAIKAHPGVFYTLAVALDVLFVVGSFTRLPGPLHDALFVLLHKCTLATALFVVVMFVGVFKRDGGVAQRFRPVRAELSIMAWLLSLGHMAVYLASYATRLSAGFAQPTVAVSLAVTNVLFALLLVLGVTSFNAVKKRMSKDGWRRVQRWAYVFFGLVYVHLMLMLLPSALRGGEAAQASVAVYSTVFVGYAVLRARRALLDRRDAMRARSKKPQEASGGRAA